jgi:acetyl esterase/lipase
MDAARVEALAAHGLTVVVPDYRLAPAAAFPDQLDDVRAAVAWVRQNPDKVGIFQRHRGVWGASAGAVLAALAALTDQGGIAAAVFWFGFSDIRTSASRSPLEEAALAFITGRRAGRGRPWPRRGW